MRPALMVDQFEHAGAILRECNFPKRHPDDFVLDPVVITDHEFTAAEFRIPADAVEEVLNGDHNGVTRWQEL